MSTIFISHTAQDRVIAQELSNQLTHAGLSVWIDEERLSPGDNLVSRITKGIENSDAVLFLLSESNSQHQAAEAATALAYHKKIIPIALNNKAKIPPILNRYFNISIEDKSNMKDIATKVAESISRQNNNSVDTDSIMQQIEFTSARLKEEERYHRELANLYEARIKTSILITISFAILLAVILLLIIPMNKEHGLDWAPMIISAIIGLITGRLAQVSYNKLKAKG